MVQVIRAPGGGRCGSCCFLISFSFLTDLTCGLRQDIFLSTSPLVICKLWIITTSYHKILNENLEIKYIVIVPGQTFVNNDREKES